MLTTTGPNRYGYLCLMRPPMPGAVPKEGMVGCDAREGYSMDSGHHYWGHVTYDRKLTREEVNHYDLELTSLVVTD